MRLAAVVQLIVLWASSCAAALELRDDDKAIEVWASDTQMLLRYHKAESALPDGVSKFYRRSGYIHPVFTPGGQEVTGDFAPDHPHQHGLFMAWTNSVFEGKKIDFWNLVKEQGRVEHRGVTAKEEKAGSISISLKLAHVAGKGEARRDVLHEAWTVTVHETPEDHFLFDIESVLNIFCLAKTVSFTWKCNIGDRDFFS